MTTHGVKQRKECEAKTRRETTAIVVLTVLNTVWLSSIARCTSANSLTCQSHVKHSILHHTNTQTRMWAYAQRDGRPGECMWCPVLNAVDQIAKITTPRYETRWNLIECAKFTNRSQPSMGRSSPYCQDMWRRYCCLTSYISDCRYMA